MVKRWLLALVVSSLMLTGLLTTRTAAAQLACPASISGSLDATDPTQTGRITRDGNPAVCGPAKGFPGMFDTTTPFNYDKYSFANRTGASACVTFTLSQPSASNAYHLIGYSAFVPTNPAANYLGDSGNSTVSGGAVTMALTLSAGQVVTVVAQSVFGTGAYTLTAAGCGALPTPTAGAIASSVNPSVFGQSTTFTGTVSGGAGVPTGTLTFFDGATSIGTGTLNAAGVGSFATSALAVATHSITYKYGGDTNYAPATSVALSQVVNKDATSTAVTSSTNPSIIGGSVTFTATVTANSPGAGTPTGSVTFFDGIGSLGTGTLSGGIATLTTSALAVGSHDISVTYGADTSFLTSTSPVLKQIVNQDGATVGIASSANPSIFGASVTFTATIASVGTGGTPTGTVTFRDGLTILGSAPITAGVATFATAVLTGGSHTIFGDYSGDTQHAVATGSLVQQVNVASSGASVASATNPSVFGQSVTFTATITGTGATPTGTVTFLDGATTLGTGTLASGQASLASSTLSVGPHAITVSYGGDTNFAPSASPGVSQQVNKADTSTTLTASSNPSIVDASVTFTATVTATAPGAGIATGLVTFFEGTTSLGTGAVNASGIATFTTSALAVGTHGLTASYAGDVDFNASVSSNLAQVVNKDGVTATLASSLNPSTFGDNVTFTATVAAAGSSGTPTGTVTFTDGVTILGTSPLTAGVATFSTAALLGGTHSITATYGGDVDHLGGSTAALAQVVNVAPSTTTVVADVNPSVFGQSVTLTATVTAGATGTVTFVDGVTTLGTTTVDVTGVATFTTTTFAVATHAISAVYSGDTNYDTSTSATLSQIVNQAATSSAVVSSTTPSLIGSSVTFTATVTATAPGAGTPTGTVTFKDGTTTLGTGALGVGGVATFATSTLTTGAHSITAEYGGDGSFSASISPVFTQNVSTDAATIAVTSSLSPSIYGVSVTFTATTTGAHGTPTGTITFMEGTTTLGTGPLSGAGIASFATATLAVGTRTITAKYSGDTTYATGSGTVSQVVTAASTTTTLISSQNPSTFGDSVTFTATVASSATGFTGKVEFFDGATSLGLSDLVGPTATFEAKALALGGHAITAKYKGDANFGTSASPVLTQTVNAKTDGGMDGGVDAGGIPQTDAGTAAVPGDSGGCGCRTIRASTQTGNYGLFAFAGLALLLVRRRRNS